MKFLTVETFQLKLSTFQTLKTFYEACQMVNSYILYRIFTYSTSYLAKKKVSFGQDTVSYSD